MDEDDPVAVGLAGADPWYGLPCLGSSDGAWICSRIRPIHARGMSNGIGYYSIPLSGCPGQRHCYPAVF